MEITFEQLKQSQNVGGGVKPRKEITFEELKSRTSPGDKKVQKAPEGKVRGGIAGELFTGGSQRFGSTIGRSIAAPRSVSQFDEALQNFTKTEGEIKQRLAQSQGPETPKLIQILQRHQASKPKVEDFTGDILQKTTRQVLGEAAETGLEALSGGLLSKGAGTVVKAATPLQKAITLGKAGAGFGGVQAVASSLQRDEDLVQNIASGIKGAGAGFAFGAGTSIGGKLVGKAFGKKPVDTKKISGAIFQGKKAEQDIGARVLKGLDTGKVRTFDDLTKVISEGNKALTASKDELLRKTTDTFKLNKLKFSQKVGDKVVKTNFVDEALIQLKNQFKSTNDVKALSEINQLIAKSKKVGLTLTEVEKIARLHGSTLKGFNISGQLSSGLNKQAAENTRSGVKNTIAELTGSKTKFKALDKQISESIKVEGLSKKMSEAVNKLTQRSVSVGPLAKLGGLVGKVVNIFSGGGASGIARSLLFGTTPSKAGQKVLNVLELERTLQKNLKLLQKASTSNNESIVRRALEALIEDVKLPTNFGR